MIKVLVHVTQLGHGGGHVRLGAAAGARGARRGTGGIPTQEGEGHGRAEEVRRPAGEAKFVLGQLNIQWRSGMGDRGSINTGGLRGSGDDGRGSGGDGLGKGLDSSSLISHQRFGN